SCVCARSTVLPPLDYRPARSMLFGLRGQPYQFFASVRIVRPASGPRPEPRCNAVMEGRTAAVTARNGWPATQRGSRPNPAGCGPPYRLTTPQPYRSHGARRLAQPIEARSLLSPLGTADPFIPIGRHDLPAMPPCGFGQLSLLVGHGLLAGADSQ